MSLNDEATRKSPVNLAKTDVLSSSSKAHHHIREPSNSETAIDTSACSGTTSSQNEESQKKFQSLNKQKSETDEAKGSSSNTALSSSPQKNDFEEHVETDESSTWRRKKSEKALVHRITNDMQLARYVGKNYVPKTDPNHRLYLLRFAEAGLRRILWYLARAVATRKILFTLLPLALVLLSFVGPLLHQEGFSIVSPSVSFPTTAATDYPSSGFSYLRVRPPQTVTFNGTNPVFDTFNRNRVSDFAVLIKGRDSSVSVIHEGSVEVYMNLRKLIQKISVRYGKTKYAWLDLCRESCGNDKDVIHQIIASDSQVTLTYPETLVSPGSSNSNITRLFLGLSLGGVETDIDGVVSQARALSLTFRLKTNLKEAILASWEKQFRAIVMKAATEAPKNANVDVFWWSNRDYANEVEDSFKTLHLLLLPSAAILVFLCCVLSFERNAYESRPVLGFVIGILLLISFIAAYSVQLTGVSKINAAGFLVFFPISGFGILLFFTLKNSWKKYSNAASDPVEKLSVIVSWEGPNAVTASLIIIISCLIIGTTTTNSLIQFIMLIFAASAAVLLIFALLFFTVFLFISGRREAKGLKWYQIFRQGDANFPTKTVKDFDECELLVLHDKLLDAKPCFARSVASVSSTAYMRCPIAFIFAIYLVFACWGCKDFKVDMREEYFLSQTSQVRSYLENYRAMFGHYEEFLELVFDEPIAYNDLRKREDLISLLDWAVKNLYATKYVSWLKDFGRFETSTIYDITADTFVPIVDHIFLESENFKKYRTDLLFDKFETQIVASRMYLELTTKGVQERTNVIDGILSQARAMEIPMFIKAPFAFNIQHDVQVISTVIFALGIFMLCVCAFTLVFYGIPALTVLVVLSDVSVIVGVIGYATHWGIPLNIVTLSVALSGNALTTAVVAYFCYHYVTTGKLHKSSESKVRYSFQSCLLPVTFACLVPLLTYLPLLLFDVPVAFHIFKLLLLSSLITFAHYLLFLPSLMMFFAEQVPAFCSIVQSACEECCCQCFETEEDSGSIYYIPTGERDEMNRFSSRHYSYVVAAPTTQRMIMQPPPGYLQVSSAAMAPDVLPYGQIEAPSNMNRFYCERRRRRDSSSERSVSTTASPRMVRSAHPTPRRDRKLCSKMAHSESRSLTDSIYEAPPSPSNEKHKKDAELVSSHRRELFRPGYEGNKSSASRMRYHEKFRDDDADQNPPLEMRSNWRQYLIEGSLRQTNNAPKPPTTPFHPPYPPPSRYYFRDNKRF